MNLVVAILTETTTNKNTLRAPLEDVQMPIFRQLTGRRGTCSPVGSGTDLPIADRVWRTYSAGSRGRSGNAERWRSGSPSHDTLRSSCALSRAFWHCRAYRRRRSTSFFLLPGARGRTSVSTSAVVRYPSGASATGYKGLCCSRPRGRRCWPFSRGGSEEFENRRSWDTACFWGLL